MTDILITGSRGSTVVYAIAESAKGKKWMFTNMKLSKEVPVTATISRDAIEDLLRILDEAELEYETRY